MTIRQIIDSKRTPSFVDVSAALAELSLPDTPANLAWLNTSAPTFCACINGQPVPIYSNANLHRLRRELDDIAAKLPPDTWNSTSASPRAS